MGEVVRAYFVPNGSYLMELAEDGIGGPSVEALQAIGHEVRAELRPDAIIVASPHWQPKSGFCSSTTPSARWRWPEASTKPAPRGHWSSSRATPTIR